MKLKKLTMTAIFGCLALIIFIVEAQLPPVWIPGIKLGLSNVVILIAILFGGHSVGAGVLLIKVILGAVFCGTVMSFAFSLCGGLLAYIVMCIALRFIGRKQIWVISIFGAISHSTGQLIIASVMIENVNAFVLLPVMVIASILTGFFTGLSVQYLWSSPLQKFRLK